MRVAFTLIGGAGWTGGINYLENLLSALADHPEASVSAVLFAGEDADPAVLQRLSPYLAQPPVLSAVWNQSRAMRLLRLATGFGLQRDFLAEREFRRERIDVVFQHGAWYGAGFAVPTLAWIADFQHRRLPGMFSRANYYWRDIGYRALSYCATRIMVSSEDAKRDCEMFYPQSVGRVDAVPFAVKVPAGSDVAVLQDVRRQHALPEKFFYLPNQFWRHKNHMNVVEALKCIRDNGGEIVIVATGNAVDGRHPDYPQQVLDRIVEYGLQKHFIFLGLVPFAHILPLMRLSAGMINPSFFEGWSTTVEEAKAVGAPLLLSDLPIHREQADGRAVFFPPADVQAIAAVLQDQWVTLNAGPRPQVETAAVLENAQHRREFAMTFSHVAARTAAACRRHR